MSDGTVILVTGATGAVGSAIVPLLLADPATRVTMLLRAPSDAALAARTASLRDYWGDRVDAVAAARLQAVRGDVGEPHLGLAERDYAMLTATVTNVVHSAGNVKLNQSITAARASALTAANQVISFVRACEPRRGCPKLEYLSTVGVAGRSSGLVPEVPIDNVRGYHNTYEQAKAETETMLLAQMAGGLPATIHRPSMVVGDSRDGHIIHFQVFYYLARFLAGSRTRGILPAFGDVKLDLVPADHVARCVVASIGRADSIGRIFHLCAGPSQASPLAEIGEALRHFLRAQGERTFNPRYLPRGAMRVLIRSASLVGGARTARALASLPYFLDYLDEAQVFANTRTHEFFAQENLRSPPPREYLPAILQYWYARRAATGA